MKNTIEIIFTLIAFLSFVPVVNMFRNRRDRKYACLRILIYSTFVWSIMMVLERISSSTVLIYYMGMLGYPLRMWFATLMLCTIFQYVEKKLPKGVTLLLGVLVVIDLGIALTNASTQWFLELTPTNLTSFSDLYQAAYGPLFIYHLLVSYAIALVAIVLLFVFLAKRRSIRQYKEVTHMMAYSVIIVLLFNLLELFIVDVDVNLTFMSLVIVAYTLYDVIYRKDMVFNLRTSGRSEILANMRELYIITDDQKRIIEISPLFLEKYQLSDDVISQPLESVIEKIKDQVVFYTEYDMDDENQSNKDHYHLREKEFHLQGIREKGHMILLYDETQVIHLLRELNKLSHYDSMTGLNNRNYMEQKLSVMHESSHLGVFSIDLNGLKVNNDYLGHERGDYLLKALANKLKEVFGHITKKEMARIGGDEFLVIVHETELKELERLKQILIDACDYQNIENKISISVGLAYTEGEKQSIYALIQEADQKMYLMKAETSKEYQKAIIEYIHKQDTFIR